MNNIAIIPARGGSKRIHLKNIKGFLGMPIIAYSIKAALASGAFDEVMVSTDDGEIAETAKAYGAKVPFMRSSENSSDMAATPPVLIEVVEGYAKRGAIYDNICCVYPCAPFVTAKRLRDGMEMLARERVDSVFTVARFSYPPQRCLVIRNGRVEMLYPENYSARSQDLEPLYHDAGQFYCVTRHALLTQKMLFCRSSLPIVLDDVEVQDIDTEDDWKAAEIKYRILYGL